MENVLIANRSDKPRQNVDAKSRDNLIYHYRATNVSTAENYSGCTNTVIVRMTSAWI